MEKTFEATTATDEFISDLAFFTRPYVARIRAATIENADEILANVVLVHLLHEYKVRATKEEDDYEREVYGAIKHGSKFTPSNNVLTHSNSYRQIIEDLMEKFWSQAETA